MASVFSRQLLSPTESFFLFGPRGSGKSTWIASSFPHALQLDLLEAGLFGELLTHPERLEAIVEATDATVVVLDEVQRLPHLLDVVHRLIEKNRSRRFALTGSSARKLRRGGANLLAGRARTLAMHPLTAAELGAAFDLAKSLKLGHMPIAYTADDPMAYLRAYTGTYLLEEVRAEAMTRNLEAFARFLTAASFSQASVLSVATLARDTGIARKTVENYFELLGDLLLAIRVPVFVHRAKRAMTTHPKFYFFDAGVYRALRPKGPLDPVEEIDGPALETLVFQDLRATNENLGYGYQLSYWHTREHVEVDFVLYGERGLHAIEVKRSSRFREQDLDALRLFRGDYPPARCKLLYGGERRYSFDGIEVWPLAEALPRLPELLA
jgi:uncharacterized protein